MGQALTRAALRQGHEVVVVSGPVAVRYPRGARTVSVETTREMLAACEQEFPRCQGLIGVAAPCDYQPVKVAQEKISKTGGPLLLELVETPDIVAAMGMAKRDGQWTVGFALETEDARFRALAKLQRKHCDLVVANSAAAINAAESAIEILDPGGNILAAVCGPKSRLATVIMNTIRDRLITPTT